MLIIFRDKTGLWKEASILHNLDHPNILKLHGLCEEKAPGSARRCSLILEWAKYGSLVNLLQMRIDLSMAIRFYILHSIAKGLAYLHEFTDSEGGKHNIVHRDMKASNVLILEDLVVKVN